jgi:hypothetical protein
MIIGRKHVVCFFKSIGIDNYICIVILKDIVKNKNPPPLYHSKKKYRTCVEKVKVE